MMVGNPATAAPGAPGAPGDRPLRAVAGMVGLIFALSLPLWGLGAVINYRLPKDLPGWAVINLLWHISLAALPLVAALILVYRESGAAGVRRLLGRSLAVDRLPSPIWLVPLTLGFPLLMLVEYGLLRLAGRPPAPLSWPDLRVPVLFVIFLAAGVGEEAGWTGYALDPLQTRWGAFAAAVVLAVVSMVWHVVPILQEAHPAGWIVWHSLAMLPLRLIQVWIYNHTQRSVAAVVVFHASVNVGEVVWPFYGIGGDYDPQLTTLLLTVVAAGLALRGGVGPRSAGARPVR